MIKIKLKLNIININTINNNIKSANIVSNIDYRYCTYLKN